MKSFFLSLLSCVAIAYIGAFLEVWTLPRHEKMFNINDLVRKMRPFFGYDDLRVMRDGMRAKNEEMFSNRPR